MREDDQLALAAPGIKIVSEPASLSSATYGAERHESAVNEEHGDED